MIPRRHFLRGLGGVVVGLPFIEALQPKNANAAGYPPFVIFMRQANGCAQDTGDEPERFWPYELGALTPDGLSAQTDRALSVLGPYANQLLAVDGLNYAFDSSGCGHTGGSTQCLTAARPTDQPDDGPDLADGESIDTYIARQLHPEGVEPLTLYGGKTGYSGGIGVISYRAPFQQRAAVTSPFKRVVAEHLRSKLAAVNTLVRRPDGWEAHNTDVEGARAVLEVLHAKEVTLLGSGGAAVALRLAARYLGMELRALRRGEVSDRPIGGTVVWTWPAHLPAPADLRFERDARVAIIAYGAPARLIAREISQRGGTPLRLGPRWLIAQARRQRELWISTGI